ncbi:hypothetical protein GQ600_10661 [Phytophthora cactorum]|nr:hypothetical protein GQ600_10661 [Phytophthora cactorum]
MAQGQLDHKAISIWAVMPGVEYLAPLPIVAPRTVIQLDGRRILGIPPGMALPIAFPATLSVDLYSPLVWAMR